MRSAEEQMRDAIASVSVSSICNERSQDEGIAAVIDVLEYVGVLDRVRFHDELSFRQRTVSGEVFRRLVNERLRRD